MRRRAIRIDRLIAVLGFAVLLLGGGILWGISRGDGFGPRETVAVRVQRQLVERHPGLQPFYIEPGRTDGVVCGYAGVDRRVVTDIAVPPGWKFISRRNRILFDSDPLPAEFSSMFAAECPGFPESPPAVRVQ
ncbi:hypothetical protein [uncultured Brevundimonas sp.]|uniref:hypothetical protein n=1 Tax=uncultured Brevundimonas sp. TaxID=213418 RepID=UPI0030ECCF63|tara:strand:- start:1022 stop:1420 length:399 start_codon:yes stop_codon:yes gene_type:complete